MLYIYYFIDQLHLSKEGKNYIKSITFTEKVYN